MLQRSSWVVSLAVASTVTLFGAALQEGAASGLERLGHGWAVIGLLRTLEE